MRTKKWQKDLSQSWNSSDILQKFCGTAAARGITREKVERIDGIYPIRITPHYASLIDWKNPADPLLKIVFPNTKELHGDGLADQSGEKMNIQRTGVPGLQHKYGPTALLLISGTCAAYCRYCFRKRFVGTNAETLKNLEDAFRYIGKHPEISNVLLSGGDSFMPSNEWLAMILKKLRAIKHVGVIRFGTKMPVYLPSRFGDEELLKILKLYNKPEKRIYVVSHIDHPRELAPASVKAHRKLVEAGIPVLSQTVLLKGVNDNSAVLSKLFRKMTNIGIRPYYLFQCRPVRGATHFHVPFLKGFRIVEEAKRSLSGLAKTMRYMMSHVSGKIEIIHVSKTGADRTAVLKYHNARDPAYAGRLLAVTYREPAHWFDDILSQTHEVLIGHDVMEYAKKQACLLRAPAT